MQSREGQAVGERQVLPQPLFVQRRPAMNRGRAATTADDATHRDDHDVHQEVLAIAVVSRVGQRLEKSADRTDIDEFGHGLLPDSIHRGNGPVRQIRYTNRPSNAPDRRNCPFMHAGRARNPSRRTSRHRRRIGLRPRSGGPQRGTSRTHRRPSAEIPRPAARAIRCAPCGCAMVPTRTTRNKTRQYRYYVCSSADSGWKTCPSKSIPAGTIEQFVVDQIRGLGRRRRNPRAGAGAGPSHPSRRTRSGARRVGAPLVGVDAAATSRNHARLVERVAYDGAKKTVSITLNPTGLHSLIAELNHAHGDRP